MRSKGPYKKHGKCKTCGKWSDTRSSYGNCLDCGIRNVKDAALQIRAKSGPYFEKWKKGILKYAGVKL